MIHFIRPSVLIAIITSFFLLGCGHADDTTSESKVYWGSLVPIGQWRSAVALSDKDGIFCSGTAVTKDVVITAAHCVTGKKPSDIKIYVGTGNGYRLTYGQFAVKKIAISPRYVTSNDFAYIVMKDPLNIPAHDFIKVLTDPAEMKELLKVGAKAHLVGFGYRQDGALGEKVKAESFIAPYSSSIYHSTASEILIGRSGIDTCQGDSGGPVYGQLKSGEWRVYGITSRGIGCGEQAGVYGLMHANICWAQKDAKLSLNLPYDFCNSSTKI